jgi:hypothetical protein
LSEAVEEEQCDCYEDGYLRTPKTKLGNHSSDTNTIKNNMDSTEFVATVHRSKSLDQKATCLVGAIASNEDNEKRIFSRSTTLQRRIGFHLEVFSSSKLDKNSDSDNEHDGCY